jgi:hypothetical protein
LSAEKKKHPQRGKSRLYELAIGALMMSSSIEGAAKLTGISSRTLQTWLQNPKFLAQYRAAKRTLVQVATARLRAGMIRSIRTLEEVQDDPDAPHAAKVTASRTILEFALRSHELEELEDRISKLERERDED